MASGPPPQPPPHGQNPRPPGAMPDGNYDIFIIPPHSAGSGFFYLPSLNVQRNSFLAGVACALLAVGVYTLVMPVLKHWLSMMAGGGVGVLLLVIGVGVAGWAWGKTQSEGHDGSGPSGGRANGASSHQQSAPPPRHDYAPPPQSEPKPPPKPAAQSGWEKAKEETRKREEARKREEEMKKRREEAEKKKADAERDAKAKAEKDKWEQARAREKEQRERDARERIARERREKDTREREAREKAEKDKGYQSAPSRVSPSKRPTSSHYQKPTARSVEDEYSYRPYDSPPKKAAGYKSSASSIISDGSYAPSATTARTTPPPSQRGPYSTKDPDKIQIKAVYLFSDSFPLKPLASLIAGQGAVTDGLILHIKTEGLFIDDDVRGVPQREWDVKAWTLKLVEDGMCKNHAGQGLHVFRATARDAEQKKYTFVLDETEAWKVAVGLARLRKGSQVRALGMNGMKEAEVKGLLGSLGWM